MQPTLPPPVPAEIQPSQPTHHPNSDEGARIQHLKHAISGLIERLDPDDDHITGFVIETDNGPVIDRQKIIFAVLEEIGQLVK